MLRISPFSWPATITLLCFAALGMAGCLEADTRGDEAVDEVTISGPPTWSNGISDLMRLKCGNCHQVPATALSPATIPTDLDLNNHTASGSGVRAAQDIVLIITGGILRGASGGVRQMPLEYATPLTDQEISALEIWAGAGGP